MSCPTNLTLPDGSTAPCIDSVYKPTFVGLHGNNIETVRRIASIIRTVARSNSSDINQFAQDILKALTELNGGKEPQVDVSVYPDAGLVNLDYSRNCFEFGTVEAACRGLYIDYKDQTPDGIALLPPGKFYNYSEPQAPDMTATARWSGDGSVNGAFYRKVDGTMILARVDEKGIILAGTRQKLGSLYVLKAREHFDRLGIAKYMKPGQSYMFEVVIPVDEDPFGEEKVACDQLGLFALLCRNHTDGSIRVGDDVTEMMNAPGLLHPIQATFHSIEEASNAIRSMSDTEGFVGSMAVKETLPDGTQHTGRVLWKLKTSWWCDSSHNLSMALKAARNLDVNNLASRIREYPEVDAEIKLTDSDDQRQDAVACTIRRLARRCWGDDVYAHVSDYVEETASNAIQYHQKALEYAGWLNQRFEDTSDPAARLNLMRRFLFNKSQCLETDIPFAVRSYVVNLLEWTTGKRNIHVGQLLWAMRKPD